MKYIKLFESNYDQICWKVPTERLKWVASIVKIIKDEGERNFWIDKDFHDVDPQGDYVFLFYTEYNNNKKYWSWSNWSEGREDYYNYKDIYQGEPQLTEKDFERAETWLSAKKYNL